jgi:hypothetical protein
MPVCELANNTDAIGEVTRAGTVGFTSAPSAKVLMSDEAKKF